MSLDVYLEVEETLLQMPTIPVRMDGTIKYFTREEWDELHPGRLPVTTSMQETHIIYKANITHNLNTMADQAGIYKHLWRPDEISVTHARELIEPLQVGLDLLKSDRERFEQFNPPNGWGSYDGLVKFVEDYLKACKTWPDAKVSVSR